MTWNLIEKIILIQSFNTRFLNLHFQNILVEQNLLTSQIFYLNEM
jgi:hypothetical protein